MKAETGEHERPTLELPVLNLRPIDRGYEASELERTFGEAIEASSPGPSVFDDWDEPSIIVRGDD